MPHILPADPAENAFLIDLAVCSAAFLTLSEKIKLRKNIDSAANIALMSVSDVSSAVGRVVKSAAWNGTEVLRLAEVSRRIMSASGISAVRYDSPEYPALLREIFDPPYMLFYRGNLSVLEKRCVSVVGTRRICRTAAQACFEFARAAAEDGCCVVSGLAFGTDSFAHKGALSAGCAETMNGCPEGGTTCAVLPGGIDTIVPDANKPLAARILQTGGCIVSEYIPGTPAASWRFVQRNRIIAALSAAVVVIQAPPGSGALITADFALEMGRDLMFHSAAFCDEAKRLSEIELKKLAVSRKTGKEHKMQNTPEKYCADGAPVIENYADYVHARLEAPGMHQSAAKQPELF